jgi:hypothetical protein
MSVGLVDIKFSLLSIRFHLGALQGILWATKMASNFSFVHLLSWVKGSFTCRKCMTWKPLLYFSSKGSCVTYFYRLKNPWNLGQTTSNFPLDHQGRNGWIWWDDYGLLVCNIAQSCDRCHTTESLCKTFTSISFLWITLQLTQHPLAARSSLHLKGSITLGMTNHLV